MKPQIGIVTVSDRASRGEYQDQGGPQVAADLHRMLLDEWESHPRLVPDEQEQVEATLIELADVHNCCLIVTTGGTGPALRDVTPDATLAVCPKVLPGLGERMRAVSFSVAPTSLLSRQVAAIRGQTVVLNLPGKPSAISECLDAVFVAVPHLIELIGGPRLRLREGWETPSGCGEPEKEAP